MKGADFCQWITYVRTCRAADMKPSYATFGNHRGWYTAATAAWLEAELENAATVYHVSRAMAKALMVLCIIPQATAHHASAVCHYVLQRRGMLRSASDSELEATRSCGMEPITRAEGEQSQ